MHKVSLRRLVPDDIDILEAWENNPAIWDATDFSSLAPNEKPPYSRDQFRQFIENQRSGIEATDQLRLVICLTSAHPEHNVSGEPIGFIDLFDYDPATASAGVGVLIFPYHQRKGYASQALDQLCQLALRESGIRTLWCTIRSDNAASRALFKNNGFVETGGRYTKHLTE